MPGRSYTAGSGYRYGFNGQEKSSELNDNLYTARFWEYDSRVVLRWNPDPIFKYFESPYSVFGRNPVLMTDPLGDDWYITQAGKKKGQYKWFDGSDEQKGYTDVGNYKVEYDKATNAISVFEGKDAKLKEIINMEIEKDDKGNFLKYTDSRAARFAIISAESGGKNVLDPDPAFMPLVISATLYNRQKIADVGKTTFGNPDNQNFKGFDSKKDKSYYNFNYGTEKRFNGDVYRLNLSLATVYNSMDQPVLSLQNKYSVADAKYMLYFSHTGGIPQKGSEMFNINYPANKSNYFVSVQGNTKYKSILDK